MLDLARVKAQLKKDDDETDEDELLTLYLEAAKKAVSKYLDRPVIWDESEISADDTDSMMATEDFQLAALMMVSHWHANRETVVIGVSTNEVPFAFQFLLDFDRLLY